MSLIERVKVPEGRRGPWEISRFTVSENEAAWERIQAIQSGRCIPAGTYTRLTHDRRGVVMSDTPDEIRDHLGAVINARGHVLINGLGIGMVLGAVLRKPEVERVTVIEIDPDVIALVGPAYVDARVEIVQSDAYAYKPPRGVRYGMVWHDIWDAICADNLAGMSRLKRKYCRRTDWQGCWAEYQCRRWR